MTRERFLVDALELVSTARQLLRIVRDSDDANQAINLSRLKRTTNQLRDAIACVDAAIEESQ